MGGRWRLSGRQYQEKQHQGRKSRVTWGGKRSLLPLSRARRKSRFLCSSFMNSSFCRKSAIRSSSRYCFHFLSWSNVPWVLWLSWLGDVWWQFCELYRSLGIQKEQAAKWCNQKTLQTCCGSKPELVTVYTHLAAGIGSSSLKNSQGFYLHFRTHPCLKVQLQPWHLWGVPFLESWWMLNMANNEICGWGPASASRRGFEKP